MTNDQELSIWQHLDELRSRMIKATLALVVGTGVSVVFAQRVLKLLLAPLGEQVPQTIAPTESFVVYFKIALIGGVCLALPVIAYQVIRYVLPGLLPNEKRYLFWLLPGVTFFYIAGVAFAALIMLPAAINFMKGFLQNIIENRWTLNNYISFVTNIMFWMGIVFQLPLIMFFLSKLGVITPKMLLRFRKFAVLINAIIAAVVTPTPDPINMMIVMVPLMLLYELGIVLARVALIGRQPTESKT